MVVGAITAVLHSRQGTSLVTHTSTTPSAVSLLLQYAMRYASPQHHRHRPTQGLDWDAPSISGYVPHAYPTPSEPRLTLLLAALLATLRLLRSASANRPLDLKRFPIESGHFEEFLISSAGRSITILGAAG